MLMTRSDGIEIDVTRCVFKTDADFATDGAAIGWRGAERTIVAATASRLTAEIVNRRPNGRLEVWGPLSHEGFEHLSLRDAELLGFSTCEYQAGLRFRLLYGTLLENEERLAAEMLPPSSKAESYAREALGDWEEQDQVRRIPYPTEEDFERYEVLGWAPDEDGVMNEDRFSRELMVQDCVTNEIFRSNVQLRHIGIEALSIRDVLVLGFTTSDYQTALRVRVLERRRLIDEADLEQSRIPPMIVRPALETHGRDCSYKVGRGFNGSMGYSESENALRDWVDRVEFLEMEAPFSSPVEDTPSARGPWALL